MKILTICEDGTARSVALAKAANERGHDAVVLSSKWNSVGLFVMLSKWADKVFYTSPDMLDLLPQHEQYKAILVDVAEDDIVKLVDHIIDEVLGEQGNN